MCLTKNYAKGMSGFTAPCILNFGTTRRWRWVVRFTPWSLYPW